MSDATQGRTQTRLETQAPMAVVGPVPRKLALKQTFVLRRLLSLADGLAISAALAVSVFVAGGGHEAPAQLAWGLATVPLWIVLLKLYGLYDRDDKRVAHWTVDDVPWIFHAVVMGSLGLWFFYKAAPPEKLVLAEGLTFFGCAFLGLLIGRATVRAFAHWSTSPDKVLLVGGGPVARELTRKIRAHPEYRLNPIGYLDEAEEPDDDLALQPPYLGSPGALETIFSKQGIDRIIVIASRFTQEQLTNLIRRTSDLDVRMSIVPDLVDVLGPSVEIDDIEGITILGLNPPRLNRSSRALKRTMDVVIASTALMVFSPLMLLAAIAIKLTSRGPAFYSQERVGLSGKRFSLYKLRTMAEDADERAGELEKLSAHPVWLHLEHDPRITKVGRFLRLSSVDELPQLWNVILGDMSLVGPRPVTPRIHEHISGWERRRLDLTPGITGLWQVLGRTTIPFEEMLKLDYMYVTNWSLWQDVRLLIRTLPVVIRRRGAN